RRLTALGPAGREASQGRLVAARLRDLEVASAEETGGVQVIRPARPPQEPVTRHLGLVGAAGGIVGGLLALAGILGAEALGPRVRSRRDVEVSTALPVLADVGAASGRTAGRRGGGRRRPDAFVDAALR